MERSEPSPKRVLIVENGAVERTTGKSMLEKLGYAVGIASSGEEALALLQHSRFDLVLCDYTMPGMSGLGLMDAVRANPNAPPFVIATSYNDPEHAIAALRRGAYGFLVKPPSLDVLYETVEHAISRHADEQKAARRIEELARQDGLTNLMNRTEFCRRVGSLLRFVAPSEEAGAVLLIKIKGLGHINHSYGRDEGNQVLKLAALSLGGLVRPSDLLARYSGDIFALYLDGIPHDQVKHRALAIMEGIERVTMLLCGETFSLALAIGCACVQSKLDAERLLCRADFALHLAREQGHTQVHIYTDADEVHKRELSHQLNVLGLVRVAIEQKGRIGLHYQPIIDLENGKISHYEALLRLSDESGKPCNTGELVKTCEVFGLIGRLDRAVVGACLDEMQRLPGDAAVAINLSGRSVGDPDLLTYIVSRIEKLRIDPARIIFELTETAAFYNLDEVQHFVHSIKALGCRFALDDFGVGFSSFYYIKKLDFDYLKLDGSFIANLPHNASDQVFVRAMVEISKVFGMKVIAEWVEDRETAVMLREFGVALGQGYHFGKPAPLPQ